MKEVSIINNSKVKDEELPFYVACHSERSEESENINLKIYEIVI